MDIDDGVGHGDATEQRRRRHREAPELALCARTVDLHGHDASAARRRTAQWDLVGPRAAVGVDDTAGLGRVGEEAAEASARQVLRLADDGAAHRVQDVEEAALLPRRDNLLPVAQAEEVWRISEIEVVVTGT